MESGNHLKFYYNNVRSIKSKSVAIQALNTYDVICLTETHIDVSFRSEEYFCSEVYSVYRKDRNVFGGGVLIAIKKEISHTALEINLSTEVVSVVLHHPFDKVKTTIIACLYRPPNDKDHDFLEKLLHDISIKVQLNSSNVIILGDFNLPCIDWSDSVPKLKERIPSKALYQNFLNTFTIENFKQIVNEPTHIQPKIL